MFNILCFGDSNTFGSNPSGGRWGLHERWTGVLQDRLGDKYHVIEEGCGGRTSVMEDFLELDKNGRTQLPVALRTHRPLDLVILMLGTNDMKHRFCLLPVDIAEGVAALGQLVETYDFGPDYPTPKVMIISPPLLKEGIENSKFTGFSPDACDVSRKLAPYYKAEAEKHGWLFLNAAEIVEASDKDKLHMERKDQFALAEAVEKMVRENFPQD